MNCIKAYGGNNLLNLAINKYYTTNRSKFKGSGKSGVYNYTYDISELPVAKLVTNQSVKNLDIEMNKVIITVTGNNVNLTNTIKLIALCKLTMIKNTTGFLGTLFPKYDLGLKVLKIESPSNNIIDQIIVQIINKEVVPKINKTLSAIEIPQLNEILGTNFSAKLKKINVIQGPALEIEAALSGKTNLGVADFPTSNNISALNAGSNTNALVIGSVSAGAINAVMKELIPPIVHSFRKTKGSGGIKGTVKATVPSLEINNSISKVNISISITGLQGGIKLPIFGWKWVGLPSQKATVQVVNKLSTTGNTAHLTLTEVSDFKMSINWPTLLKPISGLLSSVETDVRNTVRNEIKKQLQSKKIELFKLPSKIPGTKLTASLSFENNGLEYYKTSVKAMVRIKI